MEICHVDNNELSANEEDSFTFERLKNDLRKYGMVELPVLKETGGGRYKIISGHFRIRAWKSLGNTTVFAVIMSENYSREEEFDLVNNLNRVRGTSGRQQIIKIIREQNLDPLKLNLFKFPVDFMFRSLNEAEIKGVKDEQARLARINALVIEIAKEIAGTVVDEKDEMVTLLTVKDKIAAVVRIPWRSGSLARKRAGAIKKIIVDALSGVNDD